MSAAEVAAVVARIAAGPLNAHDAQPTSPVYPYVVVYADGGLGFSDREADMRVRRTITWQTTTVGKSPRQCREALDRLNAQLEDWRPTVTGRSCSKVEHELSRRVVKDDELPDRVLFYATDEWSFVSDPA